MAKRFSPPEPRRPANLSASQLRAAIPKLERRLSELAAIEPEKIGGDFYHAAEGLANKIDATLVDIFGSDTLDYTRTTVHASDFVTMSFGGEIPRHAQIEAFQEGIFRSITKLQTASDYLQEKLQDLDTQAAQEPAAPKPRTISNDVFVVHGHDQAVREEAARFITKAGLNPIILHEQASGGRTVLEKLEHYADVGFAVVLLTPDDEGGPAGGERQPRARQNVIAELFYFLGKLGRSRVCALKKGDLEIPSDIGGVVYVPFDQHGGWKQALLREFEAVGYKVDWGKALR